MARLILKSPYLKPGGKKSPGGYLKYIATREGVEMAEDTSRHLPATADQQKQIAKLLKQHRDCKDSHEYQDYLANPTRGNADAFISGIRKFMEMQTLTAPLLRELIDHIDVYETEGTGKNRTQRITIHYKFVGVIEIPDDGDNYTADTRKGVAVEYVTKSA